MWRPELCDTIRYWYRDQLCRCSLFCFITLCVYISNNPLQQWFLSTSGLSKLKLVCVVMRSRGHVTYSFFIENILVAVNM